VKRLVAEGLEEEQVIVALLYAVILPTSLTPQGRSYPRATLRRLRFAVDRGLPRDRVDDLVALAKTCLPRTP
jgi:hypothetical protein